MPRLTITASRHARALSRPWACQDIEHLCYTGFTSLLRSGLRSRPPMALTRAPPILVVLATWQRRATPCVIGSAPTRATGSSSQPVHRRYHSKAFNAASLLTDGFDIEASYQFDLQDYDIPGTFVLRSLANHISKFISDTGIPGTQRNQELAGNVSGGGGSQTYNQSGGNTLTWKVHGNPDLPERRLGLQPDRTLAGRWYLHQQEHHRLRPPAPARSRPFSRRPSTSTRLSAILYLDVGLPTGMSATRPSSTRRVENIAERPSAGYGRHRTPTTPFTMLSAACTAWAFASRTRLRPYRPRIRAPGNGSPFSLPLQPKNRKRWVFRCSNMNAA